MITLSRTRDFDASALQDLFLSVQWSSGHYPEQLRQAMRDSHCVVSAWDNDRLIGLVNALSDGIMTAYFHYLLVHPQYHRQGIGRRLLDEIVREYRHCARKVLIAYNAEVPFYERCGFSVGEGKTPLFITDLST